MRLTLNAYIVDRYENINNEDAILTRIEQATATFDKLKYYFNI